MDMKKPWWVKIKQRVFKKYRADQCIFVAFNVHNFKAPDGSLEFHNFPVFEEVDGEMILCKNIYEVRDCVYRIDDQLTLFFARNMETFEKRFRKFAEHVNADKNESFKIEHELKSFITKKAYTLGFNINDYHPDYAMIAGKDMRSRGKFAYDKFDYLAVIDDEGNLVPTDFPVFYSTDKKNHGFGICPTSENFIGAVERLSNAAVMNIANEDTGFNEKFYNLAEYFGYKPGQLEATLDEAWDIIKRREKEILMIDEK